MAAGISRASKQENVSTTLSAGITDVATSMDVNDATKLNYPCYLVIDRVDSAGTLKTTSLWEYVKVTNIVGSTLTITRAQGGSTQQSHSSGAVVEAVMTAALQEEYYNAFNPEHTASGGHIMSSATIAYIENARMAVTSQASIVYAELRNLAVSSVASIAVLNIQTMISASGASVVGFGTAFTAYKVGSFGRDAAGNTADVAYTGIGFTPKAIAAKALCYSITRSDGWSDGTTNRYQGVLSDGFFAQEALLIKISDHVSQEQRAIVKSFDADGFTLSWVKAGTPSAATISVMYLAYK